MTDENKLDVFFSTVVLVVVLLSLGVSYLNFLTHNNTQLSDEMEEMCFSQKVMSYENCIMEVTE